MMRVRVAQGVQVVHDGQVYDNGETVDVPDDVAQRWVNEGWATDVKPAATKGTRR